MELKNNPTLGLNSKRQIILKSNWRDDYRFGARRVNVGACWPTIHLFNLTMTDYHKFSNDIEDEAFIFKALDTQTRASCYCRQKGILVRGGCTTVNRKKCTSIRYLISLLNKIRNTQSFYLFFIRLGQRRVPAKKRRTLKTATIWHLWGLNKTFRL